MAYEVIKRIRGRDYRYRVESYRDPETGKARSRWTYIGRAGEPGARTSRARRSADQTREALLASLERLLARSDYAAVTASKIASEAGVAHGTFYRHFGDKRDALRAAMQRMRAAWEARRPPLATALADRETERQRFRDWASATLAAPSSHAGVIRAWRAIAEEDPEIARERRERRETLHDDLRAYVGRLSEAGYTDADPEATVEALAIAIDGMLKRLLLDREPVSPGAIAATLTMFDRAVFGV